MLQIFRQTGSGNVMFGDSFFQLRQKNPEILDETFDLRIRQPFDLATASMIIIRKGHLLATSLPDNETLLDVKVLNIITGKEMPVVYIPKDQTSSEYFLNARLACSASNLDTALASRFKVDLTNEASSLSVNDVIEIAQKGNYGGYETSEKLLDWVVSRQRKWGAPIPVLFDAMDEKKAVTVADEELPVLPSQLANNERIFCKRLPSGVGVRETDTLDTFFDSSWYYLRFLDPKNNKELISKDKCKQMPVDVYVGGIEHAAVHMFFARFMSYFLYDIGVIEHFEPFDRILPQGVVRGQTFVRMDNGQYLKAADVIKKSSNYFDKNDGCAVNVVYDKMSKSKYNGVDPLQLLDSVGVDLTRLQVISAASPRSPVDWGSKDSQGIKKWLNRISFLVNEYVKQ